MKRLWSKARQPSAFSTPLWFFALAPHKLALGLTATLLPLFVVQVVGGTVANVGQVSAVTALASVPGYALWGNLSDRLGRRRPFLFLGFTAYAAARFLFGLGQNVPQVLWLAMLEGLLGAAVAPVASALVLDHTPEEQWPEAIARYNQIGGWSLVLGSLLGTAWLALLTGPWGQEAAMRGLFFFAGAVATLSLLLTTLWLREPQAVRSRRPFDRRFIGRLTVSVVERALFHPHRQVLHILRPGVLGQIRSHLFSDLGRYYACSFLQFFAINTGFVTFPNFLTDGLGATSAQAFLVGMVKNTMDAAFYRPMGRRVRQQGGFKLLAQATTARIGIMAAFALLAITQPRPIGLALAGGIHAFTGATWAAIAVSGTAAAATLSPKGLGGRSLGLYNAFLGASGILGSLVSGYLARTYGYVASFGTAAALMTLSAVWLWHIQARAPARHPEG
ncbi:MAG: MFS transporter [Chloroflexi bacterium]|nr:MFS transporter [Chloroflexota bacterium]